MMLDLLLPESVDIELTLVVLTDGRLYIKGKAEING